MLIMESSDLMDVDEVAAYLKVSTKWVYTEAKAGSLPAKKFGRLWRFKRTEIEAWVDAQ